MKWVLALSVGAVAGAFLHLSDLSRLPFWLKLVAAADTVAFVAAAFLGVEYVIRIVTDDVRSKQKSTIDSNKAASDDDKKEAEKLGRKLDESKQAKRNLYHWHTVFKCIAAVLAVVFLPSAILSFKEDEKKPKWPYAGATLCHDTKQIQPAPDRFAIVYSAVHPGRGGQVQHTFLLDKQTGNLWQMICQKNGTVAFQETPREKAQ